jgi:phospholipid-binding lipoprotein MlaA
MKSTLFRGTLLAFSLTLVACSSAPVQEPQQYEEPMYSAERLVPADFVDATAVYDPWEGMNRRIYNFNYNFDQYVFLPVVYGWELVMPQFARTGVHNFFNNFRDIRTLFNSILQLAPDKAAQSAGRVLVNSTVGLLGFVDVATKLEFPRPVEDFGQTLGHWGVPTGPYLVLPILGPSSLRDGIGLIPDYLVLTEVQGEVLSSPLRATIFLFDAVDTRAFLPFRYYETGSAFEYETLRWLYSTKRELDVAK